jgi:hypothetical protein
VRALHGYYRNRLASDVAEFPSEIVSVEYCEMKSLLTTEDACIVPFALLASIFVWLPRAMEKKWCRVLIVVVAVSLLQFLLFLLLQL